MRCRIAELSKMSLLFCIRHLLYLLVFVSVWSTENWSPDTPVSLLTRQRPWLGRLGGYGTKSLGIQNQTKLGIQDIALIL